jgi:hypothetical protein
MGFIANGLGKWWVKRQFKDKTPKYGKNGKETFSQYFDGANKRIEANQKIIADCDAEIAKIISEDDVAIRFQVVLKECDNYPDKAWEMWWRIRWIEAKYDVDRETAHQTVRNQAKQGILIDAEKCLEEIQTMVRNGENTIYADAKR